MAIADECDVFALGVVECDAEDVRRDPGMPKLPAVMGEFTGSWGSNCKNAAVMTVRKAQKTVAEKPEFSGTGKFVETNDLVRPGKESPTGESHNEFKNGETYFLIGDALDKSMLLMFTKWVRH